MIPLPRPINIIIADDQELIRNGLQRLFDPIPEIRVVGTAATGREAVSIAIELIPDVAILKWKMAPMDGLQTAREIKYNVSSVKTLVIGTGVVDAEALSALGHGVDSFVHRDIRLSALVSAIQATSKGQRYLSPEVTTALLGAQSKPAEPSGEEHHLSGRELDVLRLMGTEMTYAEMGERLIISETTVRTYVRRIFSKLKKSNRTAAVVEALRKKLIDIDQIS